MLSVKQGSIKYHFLSLWYDATWEWTQVFPVSYAYILNIYMICKHILDITFLNEPELFFVHS